jgi:hypothetical protein
MVVMRVPQSSNVRGKDGIGIKDARIFWVTPWEGLHEDVH